MAQKFANNAVSQLASAITDTQTNFAVLPGAGGKFPTLATGDWFMATMTAATSDGGVQREIVKVNVRGADQFTVDRGQEGTQALPFAGGTIIDSRWTAGSAQQMQADIAANADAIAATRAAAVQKTGSTMTGALINNGIGDDQYGAFRSTKDIGGSFAAWSATAAKQAAVQIDSADPTKAYIGLRWTQWNSRHLAAIEAYAGGSTATLPTINFDIGNTPNAWSFSETDISRAGKGGTVYGTWNVNPTPVYNGGFNNYGYCVHDTVNRVSIYWDGNVQCVIDGSYQGFIWTSNRFDPNSKANNGAQVQHNGYAEFGGISVKSVHDASVPAPYVVCGMVLTSARGPSADCIGAFNWRAVWLRNQ
jgi:hypothetical protein